MNIMENKNKKKENNRWQDENVSSIIEFNRFNKIAFVNGILFIVLAIINIPFLYNPELDQITFNLTGKPTMILGGNLTMYLVLGILPLIIGLIFILFSILTSRKVILLIYNDGKCRYIKKGISNFILDTQVDFNLKKNIQQIQLGQRHQRFVIWITVVIMILIIYWLTDYINLLNYDFDITFYFYDFPLSLRIMILINIFFIIGILLPFTLFPRKLCRIDTSIEFIQFDYNRLDFKMVSESPQTLPYIEPFKILASNKMEFQIKKENNSKIPEHYPEILKELIKKKNFKYIPLFPIILNCAFFILILLPFFIPNFFLGSFTFKIEYFLTIAVFYISVKLLQKNWFSKQEIFLLNNGSDLLIRRKNPVFGEYVNYFANIEKIEPNYIPNKPHYLEFLLIFFPLMEIVWFLANIFTFSNYFFTQNPYTILYFIIIVGIFFFIANEYIFPLPTLSITPKSQKVSRKKVEKYNIFFPHIEILKFPPLKQSIKNNKFLNNSFRGILLILIPIIFSITWYILSLFEIVPSLYYTIF
ncbi:MAG: hypothetical protein ACTSPD_05100 [Promethearchaeota archaeon]